jgi:hypothetical protein
MMSIPRILVSFLMMLSVLLCFPGCETNRGTGTLAGAGVGALIGQAAGRNTTSTLIGAGVGAAGGYIIGNEMDRRQTRDRRRQTAPPNELQPLAGTTWTLVNITPESARNFASMIIDFRTDGVLVTTRTETNGTVRTDEEYYRVVNNTLIVNDRDYILNGPFVFQERALTFVVGDITSRWQRVGG